MSQQQQSTQTGKSGDRVPGPSTPPSPPPMPSIMIETTDNQILEVGMYALVKHSPVIRKMLYAYCGNPKRVDPVLRLDPGFDTSTLMKVVEWCDHYRDWDPARPMELATISEWDSNFLKMDMKALLEVVKASYYLEIDGLGDITCHGLAQLMEGKSPQQLREMFNIVNDFRGDEDPNARGSLDSASNSSSGSGTCNHNHKGSGQNSHGQQNGAKPSRKQMRAAAKLKQNGTSSQQQPPAGNSANASSNTSNTATKGTHCARSP